MNYSDRLRRQDYEVVAVDPPTARAFIAERHYSKGSSNTSVYRHGLRRKADDRLVGCVIWLPPTKIACQSVDYYRWTQVLSLSRMAIVPDVPKNACSFLLGASVRRIKREGRFVSLVTYADEWQEHDGGVYRACNWQEIGRMSSSPKWLDADGRQVSRLSTRSRTKATMLSLGYRDVGTFGKRKFVLYPHDDIQSRLLRVEAAMQRLIGVLR